MPIWRIPPPKIFRYLRAFSINSFDPITIDPAGVPSPLEKHAEIESTHLPYSLNDTPLATEAFQIRAPSRWTEIPLDFANLEIAFIFSNGTTEPADLPCVFSKQINRVGGM